jgi:hypothetical protein
VYPQKSCPATHTGDNKGSYHSDCASNWCRPLVEPKRSQHLLAKLDCGSLQKQDCAVQGVSGYVS